MSPSRSEAEARKGMLTAHSLFNHKFQIAFASIFPRDQAPPWTEPSKLFPFLRFVCTIPTHTRSNFLPPGLVSSYSFQSAVAPLSPHVSCWQHPYNTAPIYTSVWPAWLSQGLSYSRFKSRSICQSLHSSSMLFFALYSQHVEEK